MPSLDKQSQYGKGKVFDVIWGGRSNEGIKIKIRGELVALDCQTSDNRGASFDGGPLWFPRNDYLQTPPGPEGSNGSSAIVCRGVAIEGRHH